MRKISKIAAAAGSLFIGWGVAVHAQPLITGNTSQFGCGPIYTNNYTLGTVVHSFIPTGAGPTPCPNPPSNNNGRGLAVGGEEIFYTELVDALGSPPGFGPTDLIRVAPFNSGAGGADTRSLANPRLGSGIQDLTFSNGELFALTGYETDPPVVYGMRLDTGAVLHGPITLTGSSSPPIPLPAGTDSDGFAILPNGNFLINNGDTSCIYNEYDSATGALVPTGTLNVPGGPGVCTGVDTDGTFLYFMTDFNSITQLDAKTYAMTGFSFFNGGNDLQIEDISLVHPVTIITDVGLGHLWLGLRDSQDQGTNHDLKVELLLNGTPVPGAEALTRCITNLTRNPTFAKDVTASFPAFPNQLIVSGDVISFRFWTRIGTNDDDDETKCSRPGDGGAHISGAGIKLYYDSPGFASNIPLTINPTPEAKYYLHANPTSSGCPGGSSAGSSGVTSQSLDINSPPGPTTRCAVSGSVVFNGGNPFSLIGTWSLAPQP